MPFSEIKKGYENIYQKLLENVTKTLSISKKQITTYLSLLNLELGSVFLQIRKKSMYFLLWETFMYTLFKVTALPSAPFICDWY